MSGHDPLAFMRVRELEWHDLVLPERTLAELRALAAQASAGGLVAVVGGEQGVGKTVAVRTCAEQLRLDTWRVDCRALVALHGAATAAVLPELLAVGERPHAVVLFHDAEWLYESSAGDAGPVLLELAPGRRPPTVLETRDASCAARIAEHCGRLVELPYPDEVARGELWRRLAWRAHPLLELDVAALQGIRVSGATIEAVLEQAVEECVDELPTTRDLLLALQRGEHGRPPLP